MASIAEWVLLQSVRDSEVVHHASSNVDARSAELSHEFPGINDEPLRWLDFGCGTGEHSIALARNGSDVTGLDINPRWLAKAEALAAMTNTRATFTDEMPTGRFDRILTWDSMEHFSDPLAVLQTMRDRLVPTGKILVCFSPPWLSAYGSHMHFWTPIPWVHLLFPERAVMAVRSRYVKDGATRYEEVEGGLNRMTLRKFERLVEAAHLRFEWVRYTQVNGLPAWVARIPGVREFCVTRVTCSLVQG